MPYYQDHLLSLIIPGLILLHLFVAPYTKVEESFNIQATHDIIAFGIPTKDARQILQANYDHFNFPGVVPRSFVGALILAGTSNIVTGVLGHFVPQQTLVRGLLGIFNSFALLVYRNAISKTLGRSTGNWFLILQACQFHILFYASRTLPNMFAFGLSTIALSFLLLPSQGPLSDRKRHRITIYLLTFTGIVFRSEIAILLFTHIIFLFYQNNLCIKNVVIPAGVAGLIVGLLTTVSTDSFFWQRIPLWPELAGFYFNAIEGKSSEWGTHPPLFYFTSSLPRLLLNPLSWTICMFYAIRMPNTRRQSLNILLPLLAFIAIYSFQPHKEWRFVVYAVPGLTSVAAMGANGIWIRRGKALSYRLLTIPLIISCIGTMLASLTMLAISSLNYPGAEALSRLHELAHDSKPVISIHMDTLSCVTGVTRFLEVPTRQSGRSTRWIFDKTEDAETLLSPAFWDRFDYALAERPEKVIGKWEVVDVIKGFSGMEIIRPGRPSLTLFSALERSTQTPVKRLFSWLAKLESQSQKYVTRGWWLGVRMQPKIKILKRLDTHNKTS